MRRIDEHVEAVERHLSAIADIFAEPTADLFTVNADAVPALERALNLKAGIDAAIAYAADQANAGDRVGSSRTVDYLIKQLGLSFTDAITRLRLGHQNHGAVPRPKPEPEPTTEPPGSPADDERHSGDGDKEEQLRQEEERRRAEEERLRAAKEQQRREEEARAKAREQARRTRISQEKLRIINRELDELNDTAARQRNDLYVQAMDQASKRLPEDLREWVRTRVIRVNRLNRDADAAWKKRELFIGRPDSDGGANVRGYVSPDTLALLESALAPGVRPGHLVEGPTAQDTRTLPQRRHDALAVILRNHSSERVNRTGVGTVVISMSAKDIDNLSEVEADHRFPTNTNAMLSPADILRLGATKYNFVVVHDPETGDPLHVGRTRRLATVEQRMALLATHLVCTNPDCTQPFCNCDVHHIKPWQFNGSTDIWNLATLCRRHHSDNRDQRDGRGARGHAERDPVTGRIGRRPPPRPGDPHPAVEVNGTDRQSYSGGAKVRSQPWPEPATPPARRGRGAGQPRPSKAPQPRSSRVGAPPSFEDVPPCPPPAPGTRTASPPPAGTGRPDRQPPLFPLDEAG